VWDEKKIKTVGINDMKSRSGIFLFYVILFAFLSPAFSAESPSSHGPVFDVRQFGASGNDVAKDTTALQSAMDRCSAPGGGTVFVPAGTYLCGSLHLKNNLTLYLDAGAVIRASADETDFDPNEKLDYKTDSDRETTFFHYSLIWGEDIHHVAICGQGTIDGISVHAGSISK
jgi:polygalacturonase